ncbi:MAG TPA: LptE family protein [Smithellaceae bacterium]|nr:LptE family protein [Smithellaceae bacterium]
MIKIIRKYFLLCAIPALVMACGYAFAPQGDYIDKSIKKVYVQPFKNNTAQAEIDTYIRAAFIDQFIQGGRFSLADSIEEADATLQGIITSLNTAALSYRASTLAAEERATITMDITFQERKSGKVIWTSKSVAGAADYALPDNINAVPQTRKTALFKLATDTAEKTYNIMMSGF